MPHFGARISLSRGSIEELREKALRWLLLTDLHIGHGGEAQQLALSSLIDAIAREADCKSFDLVLLAGDLSFSGKVDEYDTIISTIIEPLRKLPEFKDSRFVAVPGNHDVDCDIGYAPTPTALGPQKTEAFFHFDETGQNLRKARAESFSAYSRFLNKADIEGVDPLLEPAKLIEIQIGDSSLTLVTVVTAFFSSKDMVNEENQTPAPVSPVRSLLSKIDTNTVKFILGHHPTDWFTNQSAEQLNTLCVQNNAIYMHGHEHRVRANFGRKGLTSVGFGAAYQASLSDTPKPYYRNSFAICELHDSLHVAFFGWDAENGRWIPDQALPANFDHSSEILKHGVTLPLPSTPLKEGRSASYSGAPSVSPLTSQIHGCYWLCTHHRDRWLEIIREFGFFHVMDDAFAPSTLSLAEGHTEIRFRDKATYRLIHAVSAHGDVVSYEQVVTLNTQLDMDSLSTCMIITLGDVGHAVAPGEAGEIASGMVGAELAISPGDRALDVAERRNDATRCGSPGGCKHSLTVACLVQTKRQLGRVDKCSRWLSSLTR